MNRAAVYLLSAGVALAMLSPALRRPPVDGFPLSTYPMFSAQRGRESTIDTLLGVTPTGEREVLSPELISGDSWANLAVETARLAKRSRAKRKALCETVAERVSASSGAGRYVEIEFVTEVYDVASYFQGQTEPLKRTRLARCPVPP